MPHSSRWISAIVFSVLLPLFVTCEYLADAIDDEHCEVSSAAVAPRGAALLQSYSTGAQTLKSPQVLTTSRRRSHRVDSATEYQIARTKQHSKSDAKPMKARDILPPHLLELGIELLGAEEVVDFVVEHSREESIRYAGVTVVTRMVVDDHSDGTLLEEGGSLYGLDSLPEKGSNATDGMINMIDLGGNYGVVSIAAFLRYPKTLRSIAVEPIPSTYFLLRWNMWLNDVPELRLEQLQQKDSPPAGVLAIHNGVAAVDWSVTNFCYTPPYTMNAHICECSEELPPGEQCAPVAGISMGTLLGYFIEEPITVLKMDCEGCEESALPALSVALQASPDRVERLVGELHQPTLDLQDIACRFDQGQYFVKICRSSEESPYEEKSLSCGATRSLC